MECDALIRTHVYIKPHIKDLLPPWPHVIRKTGWNTCKLCGPVVLKPIEGQVRAGQFELRQ